MARRTYVSSSEVDPHLNVILIFPVDFFFFNGMIVNREDLWPKITRTPIEGQNEGSSFTDVRT